MTEQKTNQTPSQPGNGGETEPFLKRWFCVAASNSGSTTKRDAETPNGFLDLVGQSSITWIDYRTDNLDSDTPIAAAQFGFSEQLVSSLTGDFKTTYQDFDTELGLRLPSVQVRFLDVNTHPLLILLKKNFILTIHPLSVDRRFNRLRRYADTVLRKIPVDASAPDKLTMLLARIIDENNERNFEHLREIEERGDEINKHLIDPQALRDRLGSQIYDMKHALLIYLDALWETVNVVHALRYGDAELITDDPKLLERIGVLGSEVNTQIGLAEHMSDVLASGLEVLQGMSGTREYDVMDMLANTAGVLAGWLAARLLPRLLPPP